MSRQQFGLFLLRNWSYGPVGVFSAQSAAGPNTGLNWVLAVSVVGGKGGPGEVAPISGGGPGPIEPVDYITTDRFDSVCAPVFYRVEVAEECPSK